MDQGHLKPSDSLRSPCCPRTGLMAPPGSSLSLRCCVFMLILFFFFFLLCIFFYTSVVPFQLFPWQDFMVSVVPRLNEECVQKPVTERTHSEGTSQHKGRHSTAGVSFFFLLCLLSVKLCRQSALTASCSSSFVLPYYCNRKCASVCLLYGWHMFLSRMTRVFWASFGEVSGLELEDRSHLSTRLAKTLHFM